MSPTAEPRRPRRRLLWLAVAASTLLVTAYASNSGSRHRLPPKVTIAPPATDPPRPYDIPALTRDAELGTTGNSSGCGQGNADATSFYFASIPLTNGTDADVSIIGVKPVHLANLGVAGWSSRILAGNILGGCGTVTGSHDGPAGFTAWDQASPLALLAAPDAAPGDVVVGRTLEIGVVLERTGPGDAYAAGFDVTYRRADGSVRHGLVWLAAALCHEPAEAPSCRALT